MGQYALPFMRPSPCFRLPEGLLSALFRGAWLRLTCPSFLVPWLGLLSSCLRCFLWSSSAFVGLRQACCVASGTLPRLTTAGLSWAFWPSLRFITINLTFLACRHWRFARQKCQKWRFSYLYCVGRPTHFEKEPPKFFAVFSFSPIFPLAVLRKI